MTRGPLQRRPAAFEEIQFGIAGRSIAEEVACNGTQFIDIAGAHDMNYVVAVVGSVRIDPPLEPGVVLMLNEDFEIMHLLVARRPEVWCPIRLRVAAPGTHLVADEDPSAASIEVWSTADYAWIAQQLGYVVRAVAGFGSVASGALHRRGDHPDDVSLLQIRGEEVYEHQGMYNAVGTRIVVPQERMTIERGEWYIVDGDDDL